MLSRLITNTSGTRVKMPMCGEAAAPEVAIADAAVKLP
jgi:hypothetical protein